MASWYYETQTGKKIQNVAHKADWIRKYPHLFPGHTKVKK
jgi:hypothetical protein